MAEPAGEAIRYPLAWPVELDEGTGVTRSLSAEGAVITTDRPLREGEAIQFSVRLPERRGGPSRLVCEGRVIRVDPVDMQWVVVVSFDSVRFEV